MHVRSLSRGAVALLALVLASAPAGAQILEVPTQFPTIQAAIDAAPDGASITVLPGQYAPFEIVGKSVSIHGAGATHVQVGPGAPGEVGVVVRDLPPFGEVSISGVLVVANGYHELFVAWETPPMIAIRDCAGVVALSGVVTTSDPDFTEAGLLVQGCSLVLVDASILRGGTASSTVASAASPAIRAVDSGVWVSNSDIRAGDQTSVFTCWGTAGRAGIEAVDGSSLYVAGSTVRGGRGGNATLSCGPFGTVGGAGAPAILVSESVAKIVSGTLTAGAPGSSSWCTGPAGGGAHASGSSVLVDASVVLVPSASQCAFEPPVAGPPLAGGDFHLVDATYPTLAVSPAPIQPGASAMLSLHGDAGAVAVLAIGLSAGPAVVLPPFDGATVLAFTPLVVTVAVVLDGSGAATIPLTAPATAQFAGASFVAQSLVFAGADAAFSNPVLIAGAP